MWWSGGEAQFRLQAVEDFMDQRIENLINNLTDYAGAAIALVLQNFLDSNPATLTAVSITTIAKMGISDFAVRDLSKREQIKVGLSAVKAIEKTQKFINEGRTARVEEFEPVYGNKRSRAEEILEGILLKSKNEHEEKKLGLIANIFPNYAFLGEFSFQEANLFTKVASEMTYTGMCILKMISSRHSEQGRKILGQYSSRDSINNNREIILTDLNIGFLAELNRLIESGMIHQSNQNAVANDGWVVETPNEFYLPSLGSLSSLNPSALRLSVLGIKFSHILTLEEIPTEDISRVFQPLSEFVKGTQ
jgi:hypothetical protein